MDPRTDLHIAAQRQAEFERRAVEYRYARSFRRRRSLPALPTRRRGAPVPAQVSCCPA